MAGWCALTRPDVFRSVVMMSAPFGGAPPSLLRFTRARATSRRHRAAAPAPSLDEELAKLPQPRKHYQTYYTTREANENMWHPPQGVHNFLRAYYHMKSADWAPNKPFPLANNSATEMAKLPRYYVMDLDKGMAEQVAGDMPSAAADREVQVAHRRGAAASTAAEYGAQRVSRAGCSRIASAACRACRRSCSCLPGRTIDVPSAVRVGQERLGRVSARRQPRRDEARVHEVRRRRAARRRRSLGAAGTGGAGRRPADRIRSQPDSRVSDFRRSLEARRPQLRRQGRQAGPGDSTRARHVEEDIDRTHGTQVGFAPFAGAIDPDAQQIVGPAR